MDILHAAFPKIFFLDNPYTFINLRNVSNLHIKSFLEVKSLFYTILVEIFMKVEHTDFSTISCQSALGCIWYLE